MSMGAGLSLGGGMPLGGTSAVGAAASSASVQQEVEGDSADTKIKKLFSFHYSPLVRGRSVTAMAWNAVNTDILAVSYGKADFNLGNLTPCKAGVPVDEELSGGLVLFWSLRNPEYPEKILRTTHAVTSLDFSRLSPMLLAVGCYNGDVMVFDVKREGADWGKPKETSASVSGGHVDPVWQVKWIPKGTERMETLVSISTDGCVLEWNLKKGLVVSTLMNLKRAGLGDGWISRQAAGFCFDFLADDVSSYIAGTEEGGVHRCSVSYNEQYLETFDPHEGPVYRLRCSTRWPRIFLSCSSDWTVKLYHLRSKKPILTMRATGDDVAINDVVWCPGNATVFASVTASGKLQIWDLAVSSIDPVVNYDTSSDIVSEDKGRSSGDDTGKVGSGTQDPESADGGLPVPPGPDAIAANTAAAVVPPHRFGRRGDDDSKESKEGAVMKLMKALAAAEKNASGANTKKRALTCVLFGERSPTVVVGDNLGTVTLYRVVDPVTVLVEGPVQQTQRLKKCVCKLADPTDVTILTAPESKGLGRETDEQTSTT